MEDDAQHWLVEMKLHGRAAADEAIYTEEEPANVKACDQQRRESFPAVTRA
jgi:hypothetical protein